MLKQKTRSFIQVSRAFYGKAYLNEVKQQGIVDEIVFGIYDNDTHLVAAEASFVWKQLGDRLPSVMLQVWSDGWLLLASNLMQALAKLTVDYPSPEDVMQLLKEHGFTDKTPEKAS